MKRTLSWIVTLVMLLAAATVWAFGAVGSTEEPAAGQTVYIAGNPDLYPIEYYDSEMKSYQGMLPELYAALSEETGIEFTYIRAGKKNQQSRMAKNKQVEIVSAHVKGQVEDLIRQTELLSFEKDGEKIRICVGFTSIADETVVALVEKRLNAVSDGELLQLSMGACARYRPAEQKIWLYAVTALLAIAVALMAMALFRNREKDRKNQSEKLVDPLTGIGNQEDFQRNYTFCINTATFSLYYIAYVAIEIEKIKTYLGTVEAERIQKYAANVLTSTGSDSDFAARIGDGTFALAFQAPSRAQAEERMTEWMGQLNGLEDEALREYRVMFVSGVFPMDSANLPMESALLNARHGYDYAVKYKRTFAFADAKMINSETVKARLQRKLRDAIKNNEFKMYLQFIVDARTGEIRGAEALSHWQNPEEGMLSAGRYIESMLSAGIVDQLDMFIFEEVCKQLERWAFTDKSQLWISCNFTRVTISQTGFVEQVEDIAGRYSFDRSRLVMELTEDSLTDDQAVAYQNVMTCKNNGFQIALDDLGSGYSSFIDLCEYPVDLVKIDRHIVAKSVTPRGNALLEALAKLAHDLGIQVLGEGVETEVENTNVREAGCDLIQGYYYSYVLPQEEAEGYYIKYNRKRREKDASSKETSEIDPVRV